MAYLKSLGVGILVLVVYLILVPALWLTAPILASRFKALLASSNTGTFRGHGYVVTSTFNLTSPLFLLFAGAVFLGSFYWNLRRLGA